MSSWMLKSAAARGGGGGGGGATGDRNCASASGQLATPVVAGTHCLRTPRGRAPGGRAAGTGSTRGTAEEQQPGQWVRGAVGSQPPASASRGDASRVRETRPQTYHEAAHAVIFPGSRGDVARSAARAAPHVAASLQAARAAAALEQAGHVCGADEWVAMQARGIDVVGAASSRKPAVGGLAAMQARWHPRGKRASWAQALLRPTHRAASRGTWRQLQRLSHSKQREESWRVSVGRYRALQQPARASAPAICGCSTTTAAGR